MVNWYQSWFQFLIFQISFLFHLNWSFQLHNVSSYHLLICLWIISPCLKFLTQCFLMPYIDMSLDHFFSSLKLVTSSMFLLVISLDGISKINFRFTHFQVWVPQEILCLRFIFPEYWEAISSQVSVRTTYSSTLVSCNRLFNVNRLTTVQKRKINR